MNLPGVYDTFNKLWNDYQTVWIISDLHFNEEDLKAGFPNRPSDDELVKRINAKVGRRDVLLILGDVGDVEYVKQLRGYKVLIAGNHDAGMSNYSDLFNEVYEGALIIGEKLILSHEPVNIPWLFNLHGHIHDFKHKNDNHHFNVCADVVGYFPINLNQFLKRGPTSKVETIHRLTIDKATARKAKRGGKKIGF